MKFPASVMIDSLRPKDVLIITANPELSSTDPHLYTCIGNFNDEFQFVIASTQKESIYRRVAARQFSTDTIVNIKKDPLCPLKKESWFDCNIVKSYSKKRLLELIKGDFRRTEIPMPENHYQDLINAVCLSENVEAEFIEYLNS